jgi:hypothetical protein
MKMTDVVRRKLMSLPVGAEVDLQLDGIPYSVHHSGEHVYRIIPHGNGMNIQRVRCHTRRTCLEKLTKALGLDEDEEAE